MRGATVRTTIRQLTTVMLSFLMLAGWVMPQMISSETCVYAAGSGSVKVGDSLITQFTMNKTIDLSNSGIDITITEAERESLLKEARASAKIYVDNLISTGDKSVADDAEYASMVEYKAQELYNNDINELFIQRLGNKLDAKFTFVIKPLASDGSEDTGYGIDGSTVKRGAFNNSSLESIPFSTVDFGASGQVYDEILNEYMQVFATGEKDTQDLRPLRDGRDVITHSLIFDLGQLKSSDESQYGWGANMERTIDKWEGWHSLLWVCDSLAEYSVFWPDWSYVGTFNLYHNPAVTYYAGEVKADVISNASFDSNGRLISISKPLLPSDGEIMNKDAIENGDSPTGYLDSLRESLNKYMDKSEDGTFRFKITEDSIDSDIEDDSFADNSESKIIEVVVNNHTITDINFYDSAQTQSKPTFTNKLTKDSAPSPISINIEAEKNLEGADISDYAGKFTFGLYSVSGTGETKIAEAANDAQGKVSFSDISIDSAGTYQYVIREITQEGSTAPDGIICDSSEHNITVKVEKKKKALTLTDVQRDGESIDFSGGSIEAGDFLNVKNPSTDTSVTKKWEGTAFTDEVSVRISWTIEDKDYTEMVETLNKAITAKGVDETSIVEIFTLISQIDKGSRQIVLDNLTKTYLNEKGKDLRDVLKKALVGSYEEYVLDILDNKTESPSSLKLQAEAGSGASPDVIFLNLTLTDSESWTKAVSDIYIPDTAQIEELTDVSKWGKSSVSGSTKEGFTVTNTAISDASLDAYLTVSKAITGRSWMDSDSFDFALIASDDDTPMPSDAKTSGDIRYSVLQVTNKDSADGDQAYKDSQGFSKITYSAEDMNRDSSGNIKDTTFTYHIRELVAVESGHDRISGITYDDRRYEFKVKVGFDSSNNTLVIKSRSLEDLSSSMSSVNTATGSESLTAAFTNSYNAKTTYYHLTAEKSLTSHGINETPADGMYSFTLKPIGDNAATAPMPEGTEGTGSNRSYTAENEGHKIEFSGSDGNGLKFDYTELTKSKADGGMGFTHDQLAAGVDFEYEIYEEIPSDAENKGDGTYELVKASGNSYSLYTYDAVHHTRRITVKLVTSASGGSVGGSTEELQVVSHADDHRGDYYYDKHGKRITLDANSSEYESRHGAGGVPIFRNTNNDYVNISVSKLWKDGDDRDGIRPDSVTVKLLADGVETGKTLTLSSSNKWQGSFSDLPKYADGKSISYTIEEENTSVISGRDAEGTYAIAISGSISNGFTITNTHTPATTKIPVTKVWNDANDQDGIRHETVTVKLLAGGKDTKKAVVLDAADNWQAEFTNLEMYKNGKKITYTVEEVKTKVISGKDAAGTYSIDMSGDASNGFTITNTHTPETVSVSAAKVWDDSKNQDGKRPSKITLRLHADGAEIESKTISASNSWKHSFTNLPKYRDGNEIVYTITEDAVDEYTAVVTGETSNSFTITNSYTPGKTGLFVEKVWDDHGNQDGIRPANVEVKLLADGKDTGRTLTLSSSNSWQGSFTDLDEYAEGKRIAYTVQETMAGVITGNDTAAGYAVSVSGDASKGYTITNTHTPATTEISGSKTWADSADQDGRRPASITIRLHANGVETAKTVVDASDNWKWSFSNLPKYEDGKAVIYTVTEDAVDNYAVKVSGYDITNSYTPGKTSVSVEKTWADEDDKDGIRPASVEVKLLADGADIGRTLTLSSSNNWQGSFTDLDEFRSGKRIIYTVEEISSNVVTGTDGKGTYASSVSGDMSEGFTITNIHTPVTPEPTPAPEPEPEKQTVEISKVDAADSRELPGAVLTITDKDGSVIEKWTSTEEARKVQLAPGEYTLTEVTAPDGYEIAESIRFTVGEDGKVTVGGKDSGGVVRMEDKRKEDGGDEGEPELYVVKTSNVKKAAVGDIVEYKIRVVNSGNADADIVKIIDDLPEGLDYISDDSEAVCNGQELTWKEKVAAGSELIIHIKTRINSDAAGKIINTVEIEDESVVEEEYESVIKGEDEAKIKVVAGDYRDDSGKNSKSGTKGSSSNAKGVKTGDDAPLSAAIIGLLAAAAGLAALLKRRKN